jgi:ribosomal protein L11 methyltransferase
MGMKRWFLVILAPVGDVEALSELVWERPGVLGIEELPGEADSGFEVPEKFHVVEFGTETAKEYADWIARDGYRCGKQARLKVYVEAEDATALDGWVKALQQQHAGLTVAAQGEEPVRDYTAVARDQLTGQLVGQRLWVGPPWADAPSDRLVIIIEPGMAFGTGDHATTQLALAALERLHQTGVQPQRILDIGTGSGVLAIAAAQLFPDALICCTDLDAQCAENFLHNWQQNGLLDRPVMTVFGQKAPVDQWDVPATKFDLVISNIFLGPLLTMIPQVKPRLADGGCWLVTGLLGDGQRDEFVAAAQSAGFSMVTTEAKVCDGHDLSGQRDVWHLVELQRLP